MIEFIFELIAEFLLQFVFEVLAEFGIRLYRGASRVMPEWVAVLGHLALGALAGAISLVFFPEHLSPQGWPRVLNLLLLPIALGGTMSLIGAWRSKRGARVLRIDKFAYGALFAFSMALVRFEWAQ